MRKMPQAGLRLLGGIVLAAAALSVSPSIILGEGGRDYSRCIQTCNELRRQCDDRCAPDCAELYPDNKQARQACNAACHEACVEQSGDCKLVCLANKGEISPTDP